jgi:hypothetical protein
MLYSSCNHSFPQRLMREAKEKDHYSGRLQRTKPTEKKETLPLFLLPNSGCLLPMPLAMLPGLKLHYACIHGRQFRQTSAGGLFPSLLPDSSLYVYFMDLLLQRHQCHQIDQQHLFRIVTVHSPSMLPGPTIAFLPILRELIGNVFTDAG